MSQDQAPTSDAPPLPPRVLTLEVAATYSPLAQALAAAGYAVDTVARPAELAAALLREEYDAVVLDLSTDGVAEEVLGAAGEVLEKLHAAPGDSRPAILAVWPSRGCDDRDSRLCVDVTISTRSVDQVIRDVEGAVATRRLGQTLAENERLRKTVLFARQTAHELAQPLTTILARAQLLRSVLKPDDPHLRAVNIICDEADRLARLMEGFQRLKEMSRHEAGRKG